MSDGQTLGYPPPEHPFHKHTANLRVLKRGLTQAERQHKEAIRQGSDAAIEFAARVHTLIVGMVSEARLRTIVSDPDGFNDREREMIGRARSQLGRWQGAVDLAFRRQYLVPVHLAVAAPTVDTMVASRYIVLQQLLERDLRTVIEDRNKAAHGQWAWILNSKESGFTGRSPGVLNYRAIQRRAEILAALAGIVHALVVSEPTFERDFDELYSLVQTAKQRIDGPDYPDLVDSLREAKKRRLDTIRALVAAPTEGENGV
jgi:hypothetical protein